MRVPYDNTSYSVGDELPVEALGFVDPKLKADDITIEPLVVKRSGGTLPWDTGRDKTLAGESIVQQDGDFNLRFTIEGLITKGQLTQLASLRERADKVKVVSEMTDAFDIQRVAFDQLKVDRTQQLSNGTFSKDGFLIQEPIFSFQLQSKENDSGGGSGTDGVDAMSALTGSN